MLTTERVLFCPFDIIHRIRASQLQKHLFKCKKNYPKTTKVTCPFNATHYIEAVEYEHHVATCPSSGNVRNYRYTLEPQVQLGTVSIAAAVQNETVTCEEDWNGDNATYVPNVAIENREVIRLLCGVPKSKRKAFRKAERLRLAALDQYSVPQNQQVELPRIQDTQVPLRIPKNAAKAVTANVATTEITSFDESADGNINQSANSIRSTATNNFPSVHEVSRNEEELIEFQQTTSRLQTLSLVEGKAESNVSGNTNITDTRKKRSRKNRSQKKCATTINSSIANVLSDEENRRKNVGEDNNNSNDTSDSGKIAQTAAEKSINNVANDSSEKTAVGNKCRSWQRIIDSGSVNTEKISSENSLATAENTTEKEYSTDNNVEHPKLRINTRCAANFPQRLEQARKISTGRGFMISCEHLLKREMTWGREKDTPVRDDATSSKNTNSVYDR